MDPAQTPPFDSWADVYESLIDWPKRLNHESPFYRRLFERLHASRILDTACGTGQHAARFHQWGLVVEGADVSPAMIAAARQRHGESPQLTWQVRSFADQVPPPAEFDVVLCTGNSLALAENRQTVQQAVHAMISALRPGGCLVLHVLNLWRLPDGPCVWQKCVRTRWNDEPVILVKGVHRAGTRGFVNLLVTPLTEPPELRHDSVPFWGFEAEELEDIARQSGARQVFVFGGYADQPYDRETSVDLILVAET